ncbi:hypothetical protein [Coleofasciculus sp. FACHB-1120]|uniref:hypothetical protein n=1 Tax=Coleofasciculus sp. FACHB-1120 TaxID=2692783 RepID=UPI001684AE14|nr:hypothetical protein [Coleofasciculus sp. FACHB-1120]
MRAFQLDKERQPDESDRILLAESNPWAVKCQQFRYPTPREKSGISHSRII